MDSNTLFTLQRSCRAAFFVILAACYYTTALANHRSPPAGVALVGDLQSELGCPGDWQPDCLRSGCKIPMVTVSTNSRHAIFLPEVTKSKLRMMKAGTKTTALMACGTAGGLEGGNSIALTRSGVVDGAIAEKFRHLTGLPTYRISGADLALVAGILKQQFSVCRHERLRYL